jgi:tetratricopeptide (TPR) repeat protein
MSEVNNENLRDKYYELMAQRDIEGALALRCQIILSGNADRGDYYSIGENYFELGEFENAVKAFTQCINLGVKENNFWFQNCAYILRAYSLIKLKKISEAKEDIFKIDEDEKVTWINGYSEINKKKLLELINDV